MRIIKPEIERKLGELEQTISAEFSFATFEGKDIRRLHEWVKCRDFLGDVIFTNRYPEYKGTIYGFEVSSERLPINKEQLQLLVRFPNSNAKENFFTNFDKVVIQMEKDNGIETLSQVQIVSSVVVMVVADKFWQRAIPFLSLYTFLLKCCMYDFKGNPDWVDGLMKIEGRAVEKSYLNNRLDRFNKIRYNLSKLAMVDSMTGWDGEETKAIGVIHNSSGFLNTFLAVSQSNEYTRVVGELK